LKTGIANIALGVLAFVHCWLMMKTYSNKFIAGVEEDLGAFPFSFALHCIILF
jgi:hypothetical protein